MRTDGGNSGRSMRTGLDFSLSFMAHKSGFTVKLRDTLGVLVWLVSWVSLMMMLNRPYFQTFDLLHRIARM